MTTVIQDQDIARGKEVLDALCEAITDLRREIEGLTQDARSGGTVNDAAAKQALGRLRDLTYSCVRAENYLNECRSKQSGIAKGGVCPRSGPSAG